MSRGRNLERGCGVYGETAGALRVKGAETMTGDEADDKLGSVEEETPTAVDKMEAGVCLSDLDFDRDLGAAGISSNRITAKGA